jgi:hypothetical protein
MSLSPISFSTYCMVDAAQEFLLMKSTTGTIHSEYTNHYLAHNL